MKRVCNLINGAALIVLRGSGQAHHWFETHLQAGGPVAVEKYKNECYGEQIRNTDDTKGLSNRRRR